MAEVFTISGALGAAAACPPGWKATSKGNCGGTRGRSPAAMALQSALVSLGQRVGDPVLRRIKPDGIIGPGTAGAVNRAFTTHIGPGQSPAQFRTGRLTRYQVAQNAATLTQLIHTETARRSGGRAPIPTAPVRTTRAACPAGWKATAKGNCVGQAALALQRALVSLGRATGDRTLSGIKVDGVIGPGTAAAVHRALTVHLRLTVPPFSIYNIAGNTQNIINQINADLVKRGKTSAPAVAMSANCPTGWQRTRGGNCKGGPARAVQQALATLGRAVRDPVLLKIKVDGVIGPGTVAAVNRAFAIHVGPGQAPADLRTGRLSIFDVAANAAKIVAAINGEVVRRGGARAVTETVAAGVCPPGWSATPAGNCKGPGAVALQKALAALGSATGDAVLRRIRADGVIGPGTMAAVNRALTMYAGPDTPAGLRSGALSRWTIARNADAIIQVLSAAAAQRRGSAPPTTRTRTRTAPPEGKFPDQDRPPVPGYDEPPPQPIDDRYLPPEPPPDDRYRPPEPPPPPGPWTPPDTTQPPGPWRPPGPWEPPGAEGDGGGPVAPQEPAGKPFQWKWVAIGGGVAVAAGVAYAMVRGRGGSDRREAPRAAPQPRPRTAQSKPKAAAPVAGSLGALTRKDFQAVADILCESNAPRGLIGGFSRWLRTQNPRFKASRFEDAAACGRSLDGSLGALTRKDFQAVADLLCEFDAPAPLVSNFTRWLRTQNPRFDSGRFERAATSCRR